MKFAKKLSNRKIWFFTILPIILFVTWISLMIYIYVNRLYNATLIISTQALFLLALLLINADCIALQIKQKHYARGIASLLLCCVFLGLQISTMAMVPKLIEASNEKQNAYQLLIDTSFDDANHEELFDAWKAANDKAHSISQTMQLLSTGSYFAIFFIGIARQPAKKKEDCNDTGAED